MPQDSEVRNGLGTVEDVIAAADALTAAADQAQQWIKASLDAKAVPIEHAHEVFTSINHLRYTANILYTTSAASVIKDLGQSQKSILAVIDGAKQAIVRIEKVDRMIDLLADLMTLATAINGAKPGPIFASLKEIAADVKGLDVGMA